MTYGASVIQESMVFGKSYNYHRVVAKLLAENGTIFAGYEKFKVSHSVLFIDIMNNKIHL